MAVIAGYTVISLKSLMNLKIRVNHVSLYEDQGCCGSHGDPHTHGNGMGIRLSLWGWEWGYKFHSHGNPELKIQVFLSFE